MCGIIGVVRATGPVDLEGVRRGRDTLAHRGPDGSALWTRCEGGSPSVALGHRRLSIIDLSPRGAQPLLRRGDGSCVPASGADSDKCALSLVFNGEIYNYVELRDELRSTGHRFQSTGDSEVLLAAYAHWGRECVARLNGMFAFAIWDEARHELFCARDRFGEKPFYYRFDPALGVFAFASEAKALVAAGLIEPEFDPVALDHYLRTGELEPNERALWRGLRRLKPAHFCRIRVQGSGLEMQAQRYWQLDEVSDYELGDQEATERFRELFRDSVRLRLRSDVPVGTSLSGGLDSSSVACEIAAFGRSAGQHAFTARMDDPALDEGHYADLVLQSTGIEGHSVVPTARVFLEELDRLCYHQEEPFGSTSIFASYLVQRAAHGHGTVVLLDGQGADELLAGYTHYPGFVLREYASRGRAIAWWRERRAAKTRVGIDPVPPRAALAYFFRQIACMLRILRASKSDADAANGTCVPRTLKEKLCSDLLGGHLQDLLRFADRNSMAFSREVRLPFLDHRLVEFCVTLPARYLYRDGLSKWLLRRAMAGTVPAPILARTDKVGFATPWSRWLDGPHSDALTARFAEAERAMDGFIPRGSVSLRSGDAVRTMSLAFAREALRAIAPHPVDR